MEVTEGRFAGLGLLGVTDVQRAFGCGRSKARLIMEEVGTVRVGSTKLVYAKELEDHIRAHGGVAVRWPKRKR